MTTRRTLLAAITWSGMAVTAGCLGDQQDDTDAPADDGGSSSNENTNRVVSIESVDDDPEFLSFEIDIIRSEWTDTEVPTLDIAVENTGDGTATWTQAGSEFAFPKRSIADGMSIGLVEEVTGGLLDGEGCARIERGIGRDHVEVTTELEPGDSIDQRYAIAGVDEALDGICPSPGTYRADYEYGDHGEWGFEFELTEA